MFGCKRRRRLTTITSRPRVCRRFPLCSFLLFLTAAGGLLFVVGDDAPNGRLIRQAATANGGNLLHPPPPQVEEDQGGDDAPSRPRLNRPVTEGKQQQEEDDTTIRELDDWNREEESSGTVSNDRSNAAEKEAHADFLEWSKMALGIETILEIKTFQYHDYLQDYLMENSLEDVDDDWDYFYLGGADKKTKAKVKNSTVATSSSSGSTIPVRGLAATRDIAVGETLIRIPLHGLLSVTTTIDQDPFLSPIMGPESRLQYGWNLVPHFKADGDDVDPEQVAFLFELSLLSVALLYHRNLGVESPLAPYIQILQGANVDSMPFLWSKKRFHNISPTAGIRNVAIGIRRDIRDMYETVMQVLVEKHPDVFGRPPNDPGGNIGVDDANDEWMFSYHNFQWAFAIVNSRHWQLPVADLDREEDNEWTRKTGGTGSSSAGVVEGQVPPADTPTDSWVQQEHEEEIVGGGYKSVASQINRPLMEHSFLAPVADLLNFGPSCTRGSYDAETHTFEIIASCQFMKGQEVTFWYSDECDDIIVGMYGFMHPMIPQCPSAEEYRLRAELLEKQLDEAYMDLNNVHEELNVVEGLLHSRGGEEASTRLRHDKEKASVRGSLRQQDFERHGVRRMRSTRSEF